MSIFPKICIFLGALLILAGLVVAEDAPELLSAPAQVSLPVGVATEITYGVQWPGDPDAWVFAPAEMPEVSWGLLELAGIDVTQAEGMNSLRYRVLATAKEAGKFEVPPFNIHFQEGGTDLPKDESGALVLPQRFLKSATVSLNASAPLQLPPTWVLACASGAALLALVFAVAYALRKRRQPVADTGASLAEQLRQTMHGARGMRLDGDFYAYYKALGEVAGRVAKFVEDGPALLARLQERAQAVGFRGLQVTDETMDADWREVERAVSRYRENAS